MSEFQFYEFRSVDKPLSQTERNEVSGWSSRAVVSDTRAVFTYSYSDFPKDERSVVADYFDAMFYTANWGAARLIFKFPADLVPARQLRHYTAEGVEVLSKNGSTLLYMSVNSEDGDHWIDEDENAMASLIALRGDIMAGDYRCLYLIWLKVTMEEAQSEWGGVDPESEEPPVPAGLTALNAALSAFVAAFNIDEDLIAAAAETSAAPDAQTEGDDAEKLAQLSNEEKDAFLRRLLQNEPLLSAKLKQRLPQTSDRTTAATDTRRRSVGQILQAVGTARQRREHLRTVAREQQEEARLQQLEHEEPQLWQRVDTLIREKNSRSYDEAVTTLKDLKFLAVARGRSLAFKERVEELQKEYSRLSSLRHKMSVARLTEF